MSQCNVERVIGRLVTDEAFRRRFAWDPGAALREMTERGMELSPLELQAVTSIDADVAARFADALDPRIQKADVLGGRQ